MKLKDKIISDLKIIQRNTAIERTPSNRLILNSSFNQQMKDGNWFSIKENKTAKKRWVQLIDYILEDKTHGLRINEGTLLNKLKTITFDLSFSSQKDKFLQLEIKNLLKSLKKKEEGIFFIKVHNLTTNKKINFGKISILPSERSLRTQIKNNFNGNSTMIGNCSFDNSNSCYIMLRIKCNQDSMENIAREELKKHLGILSLMSGCVFFLDGEIPETTLHSKYICGGSLRTHMNNPFVSFFANPLHLKNFLERSRQHKKSFQTFSRILRNEDFRLNGKIILSSEWYLEFLKELSLEQKILKLAICLEILLLNGEGAKKRTLAERIAFLLYDKKNHREDIYSRIEKFYSLRNSIVHAGILKVNLRESFTAEISRLFRFTINKILIKKFATIEEIENFVKDKKFG